jgi:urease accessory protein UreH
MDKSLFIIRNNANVFLLYSLKTQASTKIYKSLHTNQISINRLKATINSNSMLMYIPDPTTCYSKSRYQQSYHIDLYDKTSSLLFVDWFTSGRQVS